MVCSSNWCSKNKWFIVIAINDLEKMVMFQFAMRVCRRLSGIPIRLMPCRKPRERSTTPGSGSWMEMVLPNQTLLQKKHIQISQVGICRHIWFILITEMVQSMWTPPIKQHQAASTSYSTAPRPQTLAASVGCRPRSNASRRSTATACLSAPSKWPQRQAQQPAALAVARCSDGNMVDLVGNKWWDVARNTLIQLNGYHANGKWSLLEKWAPTFSISAFHQHAVSSDPTAWAMALRD